MKRTFLLLFTFLAMTLRAQEVPVGSGPPLSLDECQEMARANYPLLRQQNLIQQVFEKQTAALDKAFYPKISLNGQASYQSAVTSLPISLPGIEVPTVKRDQYKAWVEIQQPILDGGRIKANRESSAAGTKVASQEIEVQVYQIKDKVNEAFFALLLLQESQKRLDAMEKELNQRLEQVRSGIKNGVVLPREADIIQAEILKLGQSRISVEESGTALFEVLEQWTGKVLTSDMELVVPNPGAIGTGSDPKATDMKAFDPKAFGFSSRPEHELFQLQRSQVEIDMRAFDVGRQPMLSAFGQGGYGRPALNMLESSFQPYFIVGLRFTWSPFDWGMSKDQKAALGLKREMIAVREATFEDNLQKALRQTEAEIRKLQRLLNGDTGIIELQARISRTTASQLRNGTATATDYLHYLNAEYLARLEQDTHRIQLLQAIANYYNLQGQ